MTYKDISMHQGDFLNDSDDSSERKGMKRGGNNHFGSTGILKCLQCRRRKGKCEYTDPNQSCRFCADREIECGSKYSAKGAHAHELSIKLKKLREEAGMIPFPDVSRLSAIALELERRYPGSSIGEIYAMAKEPVDSAAALSNGSMSLVQQGYHSRKPSATTPRKTPTPSTRHTPVPENTFGAAVPPHAAPHQTLHASHEPSTHEISYDIDSWLTTFPSTSSNPMQSAPEFHQLQHDISTLSIPTNIYAGLQSRPRFRNQVPSLHTDEAELDYSSLIHHHPQ